MAENQEWQLLPQHRPELWRRSSTGRFYMGPTWRDARSLGTGDLEAALVEYDRRYGKPVPPASGKAIKCDAAAKQVFVVSHVRNSKTVKKHKGNWKNWISPVIGSKRVADVDSDDIKRILERARKEISAKTEETISDDMIYGIYSTSKVFFRISIEKKWRSNNPVTEISEDDKPDPPSALVRQVDRNKIVRAEEMDLICLALAKEPGARISHCLIDDYWWNVYKTQTIARMSRKLGTRISELLATKTSHFKPKLGPYGVMSIEQQLADDRKADEPGSWFSRLKGKKGTIGDRFRDVPLDEEAREILDAYLDRGYAEGRLTTGQLLFPSTAKATGLWTPLSPGKVGTDIRLAAEEAIGREVTPHWLRHTFVSEALEDGLDLLHIAMVIGDHPETVRRIYGHWENQNALYEAFGNRGQR